MIKHTVAGLACAMSMSLAAQPTHPPTPPRLMMEELSLSEAQMQEIHSILERHRGGRSAKERVVFGKERALQEAVEDTNAPEAKLKVLHTELSEARFQLILDQRAVLIEIQAVLTPEQQAKAKGLRLPLAQAFGPCPGMPRPEGGAGEPPRP